MKEMNYEEFVATQTENIEDSSLLSIAVLYKNTQIVQFFGEFKGMGTHESGFDIDMDNDNSITIPSNSKVEVFDGDETMDTDIDYSITCNDLQIYIGITF